VVDENEWRKTKVHKLAIANIAIRVMHLAGGNKRENTAIISRAQSYPSKVRSASMVAGHPPAAYFFLSSRSEAHGISKVAKL
jgi:hypothetical protein